MSLGRDKSARIKPWHMFEDLACQDHRYACVYLWPVCLTRKGWLCRGRTIFAREKLDAPDSTKTSRRSQRSSAQICAKSLQFVLRDNFSCSHCLLCIVCSFSPHPVSRFACIGRWCVPGKFQMNWQIWPRVRGAVPKSTGLTKQEGLAPNITWFVAGSSFFCRNPCFPVEWLRLYIQTRVKKGKLWISRLQWYNVPCAHKEYIHHWTQCGCNGH